MKIRGIKRGKTIELLESVNDIPDGTEIIVELSDLRIQEKQAATDEERLAKLNQLFGAWKDQPELMEIFTEIDRQRHAYQGREIDKINHPEN